jgi:adenylate cyclase, class 2
MADGGRETEIKLAVRDAASFRRKLRAAGFTVSKPRIFEANTLFDTPAQDLRQQGAVLRIRQAGDAAVLTYKGPATIARHKSREELETQIADAGVMAKIFKRFGYEPSLRYEKYRTEFRRDGERGIAMLDETPIGVFLELEGPPRWIDATARELGFTPHDYITASYIRLQLDRGGAANGMRFRRRPTRSRSR